MFLTAIRIEISEAILQRNDSFQGALVQILGFLSVSIPCLTTSLISFFLDLYFLPAKACSR